MVAQFIVRIWMHEHVECPVIERQLTYDFRKLRRRKRNLIAPSRMRPDRSFVKRPISTSTPKLRGHRVAKFPSAIATGGIEIDMRMPARDT
jgi:hypothetical protein